MFCFQLPFFLSQVVWVCIPQHLVGTQKKGVAIPASGLITPLTKPRRQRWSTILVSLTSCGFHSFYSFRDYNVLVCSAVTWRLIMRLRQLQPPKTERNILRMQNWWTCTTVQNVQYLWCKNIGKRQAITQRKRTNSERKERNQSGKANTHGNLGIVRRTWWLGGRKLILILRTWCKGWLRDFRPEPYRGIFCETYS